MSENNGQAHLCFSVIISRRQDFKSTDQWRKVRLLKITKGKKTKKKCLVLLIEGGRFRETMAEITKYNERNISKDNL